MMLMMKLVPGAAGLILCGCPIFGTEPQIHGGYAVVEGTVTLADGSPYPAAVHVECGSFAFTPFHEGGHDTGADAQGRYRVLIEEIAGEAATDGSAFTLPCMASAPGEVPSASHRADVRFHRHRTGAPITRIDLVEGEVESDAGLP